MSKASAGDLLNAAARRDPARARAALRARLEERRPEIEQALLDRLQGIADPTEVGDPAYLVGLWGTVSVAIEFGLATLESSQECLPLIPPALLAQARLAARSGVGLDTVLRRYAAGHALLVDFLVEEVERDDSLSAADLRRLLAVISAAIDRLLVAVSEEHARELESRASLSPEGRLAERVERLLAGELTVARHLDYPLDVWQLGLVAEGADARTALRDVAREADRRLLAVEPHAGTVWAWLGGRAPIDAGHVAKLIRDRQLDLKLGLGEAGRGIGGWQLSHRQALAVLPFAEGSPVALARYAEKGVLASIRRDQVLADSLRKLYLEPLSDEKEGCGVLGETLHAYFAAECSISSAASALRIHRQTVTSRLRAVEERLGRPISECFLELSLALTLASGDHRSSQW